MSARFNDEVDPVGEPLAHLIGLGDGTPYHLRRCVDQNLPLNV
jgi:hypothetical protein